MAKLKIWCTPIREWFFTLKLFQCSIVGSMLSKVCKWWICWLMSAILETAFIFTHPSIYFYLLILFILFFILFNCSLSWVAPMRLLYFLVLWQLSWVDSSTQGQHLSLLRIGLCSVQIKQFIFSSQNKFWWLTSLLSNLVHKAILKQALTSLVKTIIKAFLSNTLFLAPNTN